MSGPYFHLRGDNQLVLTFERPRVAVIDNFLSDIECDYLVTLAEAKLKPSLTVDNESGGEQAHHGRTSWGTYLFSTGDDILIAIEQKLAVLTNLPAENGEAMQVLRYDIGQQYEPHYDYFDPVHPGSAPILARGGQRLATVLMYLNDVEAGGETIFPEVGLRVFPKKRRALLFYNVTPEGALEPLSKHGGEPVQQGLKWVATRWIREGAFK